MHDTPAQPITTYLPVIALLRREFVGILRWHRTSVAFLTLFGLLTWAVGGLWPTQGVLLGSMAWQAQSVVGFLISLMFMGAVVLMPGIGASSIMSERVSDTYEQLCLTLLRPWQIILCKLGSTAGIYVLFGIGVLPIFGTTMFLVGLDPGQIIGAIFVLLLTSITCAAIGMANGAASRNSLHAVVRSYFWMLLYLVLPMFVIPFFVAITAFGTPNAGVQTFIRAQELASSTTPLGALYRCMAPYGAGTFRYDSLNHSSLYSITVTLFALLLVWWRLRKPSGLANVASSPSRIRLWKRRGVARKGAAHRFPDGLNPIMARELLFFEKPWHRLAARTGFIFLVTFTMNWYSTRFGNYTGFVHYVSVSLIIQMCLSAFAATALGANILTRERELDTMDLLRTTLLTPRQVVFGKSGAAMAALVPLLLGMSLGDLIFFGLPPYIWPPILTGMATVLVCAALGISLGVVASTMTRRAGSAVTVAFLLSGIAFVGIVAFLAMSSTHGPNGAGAPLWFSPIFAWGYACVSGTPSTDFGGLYWATSMLFSLAVDAGLLAFASGLLAHEWGIDPTMVAMDARLAPKTE